MNQKRYTESQVMCGLLEVWQDFTGVDNPFDANSRIDTFMKADGSWDELDLANIFRGIERFFGFTCPDNEWTTFFCLEVAERSIDEWDRTVAPNLTFGSLARFIAERAPAVALFDPIFVFGRECAPAGIFIGIQSVVANATKHHLRFPPSERIINVLQGHELDKFWTQLRWMTEQTIPELPASWRGVSSVTGCLGVLAVIIALVTAWETSHPAWIIPALLTAIVSYAIAWAYKRFTNPLPSHIVSFRDLSMLIANART